jgi:hypothetical protein
MKTMRDEFEKYYRAVPVEKANKKGFRTEYRYIGEWYVFGESAEELKKAKRYVANALLSSLILYLVAGMQYSPLNYARYVQLFGMLSLAPFVFEAVGAGQLIFSKDKVTCLSFRDIREKLLIAPFLHGCLLVLAAGAGVWSAVSMKLAWEEYLIPACYFLSGMISLSVSYKISKISYHKEKNYA